MGTQKIRKTLMKELDDLMNGKVDADHAHAVGKIAGQAIYSHRLELENKRIEAKLMADTEENRWKYIDTDSVSIPTLKGL